MGLDLRVRDSGQFRGRRKLTKKGNSELRRLLFNAAMQGRRRDLWVPCYLAMRTRGMSTTAAFVALGRKLARVCFALLRNGTVQPQMLSGRLLRNIESILASSRVGSGSPFRSSVALLHAIATIGYRVCPQADWSHRVLPSMQGSSAVVAGGFGLGSLRYDQIDPSEYEAQEVPYTPLK